MFGRKKKKEGIGGPAPHIPVHTMKDDLDGATPDQISGPGNPATSQTPLSESSMGSSSPFSKKPVSNGSSHKPSKSPFLSESKSAPPVSKNPTPPAPRPEPIPIPPKNVPTTPPPAPVTPSPPSPPKPQPIPIKKSEEHKDTPRRLTPPQKTAKAPLIQKQSYEPEHKPFPVRESQKPSDESAAPTPTPPAAPPTPPAAPPTSPSPKPATSPTSNLSTDHSPLSHPAPQEPSKGIKRSYIPPSVGPLAHPSERLRGLKAQAQQQRGMGAPSFRKIAQAQNSRAKIKFDDEQPHRARTIFLILFFIVLIFAVVGAGYYFWRTQQTDVDMEALPFGLGELLSQNEANDSSLVPPLGSGSDPIALEDEVVTRSVVVDQETFTQADVSAELERLSQLLLSERYSSLVEVDVVDTNENPIGIFIFNNLFGLRFSGAVMNGVDEEFRLFFYPEKNETRSVLAISLEQGANTMNAMRSSESALATNVEPLYFFTKTNLIGTNSLPFVSNDYKTYPTRYKNFATDGSLSLDYTVVGNYLVIGTSKQSFYSVVDLLETEIEEESSTPLVQ